LFHVLYSLPAIYKIAGRFIDDRLGLSASREIKMGNSPADSVFLFSLLAANFCAFPLFPLPEHW
jgi:hypothetical protein